MDDLGKEGKKGPLIEISSLGVVIAIVFLSFAFIFFYLSPVGLEKYSFNNVKNLKIKIPSVKFGDSSESVKKCGDNTIYSECSEKKPYFCDKGKLVEKASLCGCPDGLRKENDSCISPYQTSPKNITLNYILRGKKKEINYVVYKGMVDYLSSLSRVIQYYGNETPLRKDFKLRKINEIQQRNLLLPLVVKIQNLAPDNKEDQARIAISLVQMIKFGESDKKISLTPSQQTGYSRYPYEVLYESEGICEEKSELLAFLLREIGYGVAFFYNNVENHESIGIKCPIEHSYRESGYCFVETTGPSIMTDDNIVYVGGIRLKSSPEIIVVSDGLSLGDDLYEYKDAEKLKNIRNLISKDKAGVIQFIEWGRLYKKYGLADIYFP